MPVYRLSPPMTDDSGTYNKYIIVVGAVDFAYILAALTTLTEAKNWDVSPLLGLTPDQKAERIQQECDYFSEVVEDIKSSEAPL